MKRSPTPSGSSWGPCAAAFTVAGHNCALRLITAVPASCPAQRHTGQAGVSHLGERLSAFIDGELSHQQRERVLAHLANCAPCRREAAALRMLKQRMHALGEATADTALTDRLIAVAGVASAAPWRRRLRLAAAGPCWVSHAVAGRYVPSRWPA